MNADRLRQLLTYDPSTGLFAWVANANPNAKRGWFAGRDKGNGYLRLQVEGRTYATHRIAWLYMTGTWPEHEIDHIDGNRSNNVWRNLRDVTRAMNCQNLRRAHRDKLSSRMLGVFPHRNKWRAEITAEGRRVRLGSFTTEEEAQRAYLDAKRSLHSGCTV